MSNGTKTKRQLQFVKSYIATPATKTGGREFCFHFIKQLVPAFSLHQNLICTVGTNMAGITIPSIKSETASCQSRSNTTISLTRNVFIVIVIGGKKPSIF